MYCTRSSSSSSVTPSQLFDEILKTKVDKPNLDLNGVIVHYDAQLRKTKPIREKLGELPSASEASNFADEVSTNVKQIAHKINEYCGNKRKQHTSIEVLDATGSFHLVALGVLMVGPAPRIVRTLRSNNEERSRLVKSMDDLSLVILQLQDSPGFKMKLHNNLNESIRLIVKGAIFCCSQKKRTAFKRLFKASTDGLELQQITRYIDDMFKKLLLQLTNSALTSNLVVSPATLNNDAVAMKEQIEGVYDIGGSGKTTLAEEATSILEGVQIHTNLSSEQIIYIKSICRESHLIGKGSFAQVYRGIFQGKDFAIKKIEHRSNDTKKWMENEVELLRGIEHKNINMLYAWCIEASISYLVYMYISGCSLNDYLRGNCIGFAYSWMQCFKMIIGIAEGIEFLHKNKIIHVDIKPQNIMVDANDNEVKLVDFGFSRKADWEGTHCSTDKIIGTRGYWAPEYCFNHKLSFKHDVFSFGIVVLEMITGEKHVDNARGSSQFHIPDYVNYMISNDRFEEAVDPRLKQEGWNSVTLANASSVANIALRCVSPDKAARPFMDSVVKELTSIMMSTSDNMTTV